MSHTFIGKYQRICVILHRKTAHIGEDTVWHPFHRNNKYLSVMKRFIHAVLFIIVCLWPVLQGNACTNFLLSRGATADGSTMITYAADSHTRYGQLRYHPGGTHPAGEILSLYTYGSLKSTSRRLRSPTVWWDSSTSANLRWAKLPGEELSPSARATPRA